MTEVKVHAGPATAVRQHHHTQRTAPPDAECYKCGKKEHLKGSCRSKNKEEKTARSRMQ